MDIVIISQYLRNIENFEDNNSRFVYLAKMLAENNNVEIITSDFNHSAKKHFGNAGELQGVKITALHEPGYPKNICLKRFYSHKRLAKNIGAYLGNRAVPDVIYCAIPSLDVALEAAKYAKKKNVTFALDIQDLWPEAFKMVFNIPVISDMIFYPMERKADRIYGEADILVSVSDTYLSRALSVNKKCRASASVFLGTELSCFDTFRQNYRCEKTEDAFYIGYVGTLSHSYNISAVIDAIAILNDRGEDKYKFIVMGDGGLRQQFEDRAKEKGINAEFTGKLNYPEMVGLLCICDICVNPIKSGSAGSVINKVGDYAASGLPVINTQESYEYRELLEKYDAGINCDNNDIEGIADAIEKLCRDKALRDRMGAGNRAFAEERFDRKITYKKICELITE